MVRCLTHSSQNMILKRLSLSFLMTELESLFTPGYNSSIRFLFIYVTINTIMFDPLASGENLLIKYIWIVFLVFWLVAGGMSWALIYHWIKYAAVNSATFKFMQALYVAVLVFLFFLSLLFIINI